MTDYLLLDAGIVGQMVCSPGLPATRRCLGWAARAAAAGSVLVVPHVTDFEVRRELVRLGASAKLCRLDGLLLTFGQAHVTPEAWRKAAEFWAVVRKADIPTADTHALDGGAILAAVGATMGGGTGSRSSRRIPGISADSPESSRGLGSLQAGASSRTLRFDHEPTRTVS